jgi:hypothetical protein
MKRIVIGVIVAVALLIAIDFIAASVAEYQVSTSLKTQLSLPDEPAVRITGFPFLAQAVLGDYRRVDVSAENVGVGSMRNVGVFAELYHVRVPLSDLLSGSVRDVTVDSVAGSVLITKEDLLKLLGGVSKLEVSPITDQALDDATVNSKDAMPGSSVTGINPDQAVRMAGTMSVLGQKVRVSVIAVLQLTDGQIEVIPRDIRVGSGTDATKLPEVAQAALRKRFTLRINPGTLPFAVTPTRLRAAGDGLSVSGTAQNVTLGTMTQRSSN